MQVVDGNGRQHAPADRRTNCDADLSDPSVLSTEDDIDVTGGIDDLNEAGRYIDQADIAAYHAHVAGPALFDGIRQQREDLPVAKLVLLPRLICRISS